MTAIGSVWVELVFNDNWHWTNDSHTEARKGRWVASRAAEVGDTDWSLSHYDFPGCYTHSMTADIVNSFARRAQSVFAEFLAWQAAQQPETHPIPEEPTGLGAVVEVCDDRFTRCDDGSDGMPWRRLRGGWMHWPSILALGPVTVLSPGVNP